MRLLTRSEFHVQLDKLATQAGRVALIVVLAWVACRVLRRVTRAAMEAAAARVGEEERRERLTTVLLLVNSVIRYVVVFVAVITILDELGVDVRPVLAAAGVVGLAVGFGAQNLVRDVVSGFFITMEGQYAVGDSVEINGVFGRVEEISLRTTRIRDPNGQLRYFPNGAITSANNYTEEHIAYVVSIPLGDAQFDAASLAGNALADFDREFKVFAQPPEVGQVTELSTYAPVLRVDALVIPGRQGIVESRLAPRLTAAFERAGRPVPSGTEVSLCLRYPARSAAPT